MDQPVQNTIGAPQMQIDAYLDLMKKAVQVKANAHCRYSGIQVGAALLAKNGTVITGCNVENASYGLTMCAERTAVFNAVSEGFKPGDFEAIAIAASGTSGAGFSPCGACREVLNEFGEEMAVIFEFGGKVVITNLDNLLPFGFKF